MKNKYFVVVIVLCLLTMIIIIVDNRKSEKNDNETALDTYVAYQKDGYKNYVKKIALTVLRNLVERG